MSFPLSARLAATAVFAAFVTPTLAARAQAPQAAPPATAGTSPAKQLGLTVYPAKGQAAALQATDEQACYDWAQQQTGLSGSTPAPNADSAGKASKAKTDSATQGVAVAGAAKGAVAGVAIGAIAGDAGKGAAIGAVAGAAGGRRAKKQAGAQAEAAGKQQAAASQDAKVQSLKKAMAACLEGKGYTAK